MAKIYSNYQGTALWRALAGALKELEATGEIRIETAPDYVIGYFCQELAAKRLVESSSLKRDRG
jgi:hypothetical protein